MRKPHTNSSTRQRDTYNGSFYYDDSVGHFLFKCITASTACCHDYRDITMSIDRKPFNQIFIVLRFDMLQAHKQVSICTSKIFVVLMQVLNIWYSASINIEEN